MPSPRQIIEALPQGRIDMISHLIISPVCEGWELTVHYIGGTWESDRVQSLPHHVVQIDRDQIPPGVSLSAWAAWPDTVHDLGPGDPELWIRELVVIRELGGLNHALRGENWHVRTHAGSDPERSTWVMAHVSPEGKERMLEGGSRDH